MYTTYISEGMALKCCKVTYPSEKFLLNSLGLNLITHSDVGGGGEGEEVEGAAGAGVITWHLGQQG